VSAAAPSTDHTTPSRRAGLRDALRRAVCEAEGFAWDSDMLEPDEYGDHADTVLAVLCREWPWLRAEAEDAAAPSTDQAAGLASFVLWLDASDGSVPTHDGVRWPDGTTTIHHRHFGITTTHHDPEAACRAAHGEQGRIVWPEPAPADRAAVLEDAADRFDQHAEQILDGVENKAAFVAKPLRYQSAVWSEAAETLRRLAAEAPKEQGAQADEMPASEELVHIGWWCWRGDNHGHLTAMACRSDNVPVSVPADWARDMEAEIRRLSEEPDDVDLRKGQP
jgi:hypothetical protein